MCVVRNHFPGRIRFKVKELSLYPGIGSWVRQSLIAIQGVEDIRVNEYACSIVVHYDPQLLNDQTIDARLQVLELSKGERSDVEHLNTRGDVALNLIGILASLFLPQYLGSVTTATLIAPSLAKGFNQLRQRKLSIEVLDAVALGLSFWRGDFKTAMMTQSLISFGEYMEHQTNRSSDRLLADLMTPHETTVWKITEEGQKVQCHSSSLNPGDLIELMPGDAIPIDGGIVEGMALINQSSLTGESVPVRREAGAVIYSGTSVYEGQIKVKVDKVGSESTTAQIAKLIYDSLAEKSETQQITQQMADRRVKITLGIGAAVFVLTQNINRVASVFLVDYSCALKLSTPVTFKSIMYRAAQNGILLKGGSAIEKLVGVDTCVFDKTGTLTYGDMEVTDVISFSRDNSARDLLAISASVEEHSNHPLSQAIVSAARNHQLPHIDHGEVEYVIAHGLRSQLDDCCLVMGSRHFLEIHEQVDFTLFETKISQYEQMGRHLIFISHQGELIGMIGLRDHLRDDVLDTLNGLRELGVKQLVMISGDQRFKAEKLGKELKFDRIYAQATPKSKSEIIESLQQEGHKVMFVGDGVNDAPALSCADVGVAMCVGTELARQVADVVLLKDQLYSLVETRQLAKAAMSIINSNIKIAEYVNSGIMLAAAMGWLNPALSSLLHNGTTLGILARSISVRNARCDEG
ncbi:MAG: Manganese-exporting P-type ATPase [Candidatus Celerinatantimonas neptuna]|nr:MAG: Manganese-exporting P-type ATPase [Candidatus Celerinatantimonas neptuna]